MSTTHVSKPDTRYVPVDMSRQLLRSLANAGTDPRSLADRLPVPVPLAEILAGRVEVLSRLQAASLNRECICAIEEHARRGGPARTMSTDEFQLMCFALISCDSLREALACAQAFFTMLDGRAGAMRATTDATVTRLSFDIWRSNDARSTLLADVYGFRSLHGLFSWLIGEQIEVVDATAVHPARTDGEVLSTLFPYPIHFGARGSSFAFSSAYLDRRVIRSKHELRELLNFFPFELHSPEASSTSLSERIRAHCRSALLRSAEMPSLESLTRLFRQSSATIRRRLEQEGTSLRLIKQECRLGLASEYLRTTSLTHDEIAERLGYSATKPFVHAFKSWSGEAPSVYRKRRRELS